MRRKRKPQTTNEWVQDEKQQAEKAVQESQEQLEAVQDLAKQSSHVNRIFKFHKQRNMFAEGFRLIIKEAHQP